MGEEQRPHRLVLDRRSVLTVTAVTEVISFDEESVVLKTELGTLLVQGRQLRLKSLTPEGGQIALEGNVSALSYAEPRQSGGWLRRLLG